MFVIALVTEPMGGGKELLAVLTTTTATTTFTVTATVVVVVVVVVVQSLWEEARNYPLYSLLKNKTDYVFVCINEMAVKVHVVVLAVAVNACAC